MVLTVLEGIFIRIPEFWFSDQVLADLEFISQIWLFSIISTLFFDLLMNRLPRFKNLILIPMLPGIIIHEIGHLIGCLITFTKIDKVVFLQRIESGYRGYVSCKSSNKSPLVSMIISIAPIILGSIIFYYVNQYMEIENLSHLNSALITYFTISIICMMGPSTQDLKVMFHNIFNNFGKLFKDLCVIGCSLFIYAVYGQNITELLGEIIFVHLIIILLIVLLINIIITIITKIIKVLLNPRENRGEMINPMVQVNDLQVNKKMRSGHTGYLGILSREFENSKEESKMLYDKFIDENL